MAKSARKPKSPRRYVPRQTRKFQLRHDHPVDQHVAEILDYAKTRRREVTLIREGVALWWALENGNLDYLFEKFPQYRARFQPDTSDLIEQFRQLLQQQSRAGQEVLAGPKPLPAPRATLPRFADEDDQETLVIKKDTSTNAGQNLLNLMLGL